MDLESTLEFSGSLVNPDRILIIENLSRYYLATEAHVKFTNLLKQTEQILSDESLNDSSLKASYHHYLAIDFAQKKQYALAKDSFEQSLRLQVENCQNIPTPHPLLRDTLHNLSCVELSLGNTTAAEVRTRQAIALHRNQLPQAAIGLANSLITLGHVRSQQGRFTEAEAIYHQVQIRFNCILTNHPLLAHLKTGYGHLYAKLGQYERAKMYYLEAIAHLQVTCGINSPLLSTPAGGLAALDNIL
ncbi:MAG: tetratricopeptide repeat protein [Chloroflexaceae bacterium]|nr:tetratricopeptide repeat protein [Chloroflexaceae bacterium]